jgi:hypothetical protein
MTYMEEHNLSPPTDREGLSQDTKFSPCYYPNGKNEWIAAVKNVYKKDGKVFTGHLQDKYPHLYEQGAWIFCDWNKALLAAGFDAKKTRMRRLWDQEKIIKEIRGMRDKNLPLYAQYGRLPASRTSSRFEPGIW